MGNSEHLMPKIIMMCCCSHYVKISTLMGCTDLVFIIAFLFFKAISITHRCFYNSLEIGNSFLQIMRFLFTYLLTLVNQYDNYKLNIFLKSICLLYKVWNKPFIYSNNGTCTVFWDITTVIFLSADMWFTCVYCHFLIYIKGKKNFFN